eukprot:EC718484.1.p3 GENE.EC718484.1~~EC718484.1.p3  ORF type:complete len:54 (+),score=5.48 EC718484.1:13-174(+)
MSDESASGAARSAGGSSQIHLDGLALLKITKHCKENLRRLVSGQVLGIDFEDR